MEQIIREGIQYKRSIHQYQLTGKYNAKHTQIILVDDSFFLIFQTIEIQFNETDLKRIYCFLNLIIIFFLKAKFTV